MGDERRHHVRLNARVGWLFVDSAGFDSIGIFHCKRRNLAFTCTNAVGDSFRYTA
jgi:hypothetical protein